MRQLAIVFFTFLAFGHQAESYEILHSMRFAHQPELDHLGIKPVRIVYADQIWIGKKGMDSVPNISALKHLTNPFLKHSLQSNRIVVLDVEHWPLRRPADAKENLPKYLALFQAFKRLAPDTQFGYYGTVPIVDFVRSSNPGSTGFRQWQIENSRLTELASSVDIFFPSLYARRDNVRSWLEYARSHVNAAKAYHPSKPVFLFLMPQFHPIAKEPSEKLIPGDFWRTQLEFSYEYADGVVLWGGKDFSTGKPLEWNENAAWWQETKAFLRRHNLH